MTAPESPANWVWLARIRRPQGRKGEVFAELLTDFPDKFAERRQLWLLPTDGSAVAAESGATGPESQTSKLGAPGPSHSGTRDSTKALPPPRPIQLTNHWLHKGGIVLHFAGVDSISEAETLKGLIVAIPRAQRSELTENEAYISDLVGCMLIDVAGPHPVPIGTIEQVDRSAGAAPLLVIRNPRGEILVPFAKGYLRRINLNAKRVEMALPEGLADLNSPNRS
jgi:16S rRNA processing protein RimM